MPIFNCHFFQRFYNEYQRREYTKSMNERIKQMPITQGQSFYNYLNEHYPKITVQTFDYFTLAAASEHFSKCLMEMHQYFMNPPSLNKSKSGIYSIIRRNAVNLLKVFPRIVAITPIASFAFLGVSYTLHSLYFSRGKAQNNSLDYAKFIQQSEQQLTGFNSCPHTFSNNDIPFPVITQKAYDNYLLLKKYPILLIIMFIYFIFIMMDPNPNNNQLKRVIG